MDREYVQNEVFRERDNSRDIKTFIYTLGVELQSENLKIRKKLLKNNKSYRFNVY